MQNLRNPFNSATSIEYSIPRAGDVEISIFTLSGQRVREILVPGQAAGKHRIRWETVDQAGVTVRGFPTRFNLQADVLRQVALIRVRL